MLLPHKGVWRMMKELGEYSREQKCSDNVVEMINRKPIRRTPMVDPLSATSADYRCHTWHRDSQLISVVRFIISKCHRHPSSWPSQVPPHGNPYGTLLLELRFSGESSVKTHCSFLKTLIDSWISSLTGMEYFLLTGQAGATVKCCFMTVNSSRLGSLV